MNQAYVEQISQTGDVMLVHGDSAIQKAIEVGTSSAFCHVALLVRVPGGLLISEMVEGVGYQSLSLTDWLAGRVGESIFFGQAPGAVRQGGDEILAGLSKYDEAKACEYDYAALPLVWLSHLTGKTYGVGGEVCSLKVQHDWFNAGFTFSGDAAPADFLFQCESVSLLK
jgi:hypothetical protein